METSPVNSPCVAQCKLTEDKSHCLGCLRTLNEIRDWSAISNEEKQLIIEAIKQRRKNNGHQTKEVASRQNR